MPGRFTWTASGCTSAARSTRAATASRRCTRIWPWRRGPLGSVFRMLDKPGMRRGAAQQMAELKIGLRSLTQAVENLSGGQRQGVSVARAAAWAEHMVIMVEPTAALGVKESGQVLDLIRRVRDRGLPVVLISHNMPHVFEIADRIHIQ